MKKLIAVTAISLFATSSAAWACEGFGKVAEGASGPITTALDSGPITPKPQTTKSGG